MCPTIYKVHIIKRFHLLSTSYRPGLLLDTRGSTENKIDTVSPGGLLSSGGETNNKPKKKVR